MKLHGLISATFISLLMAGMGATAASAAVGDVTPVAGTGAAGYTGDGGVAVSAKVNSPQGVAADANGNLFIADSLNHRIRRVDAATGVISTVVGIGLVGFSGDGGPALLAKLNRPVDVAVDSAGNLYIADQYNFRVRRVDAVSGVITTVAGVGLFGFTGDGGLAVSASFSYINSVRTDALDNLFVADMYNHRVRRVDAVTHIVTTVAGGGGSTAEGVSATGTALNYVNDVAVDKDGNLFVSDYLRNRIRRVDAVTGLIRTVAPTSGTPRGIEVDAGGNAFFTSSMSTTTGGVYRLDGLSGVVTTVVPQGNDYAKLVTSNREVYVAAGSGHRVLRVEGVATPPAGLNRVPVAAAGADQVLECSARLSADVVLDGSASFDLDNDPLMMQWSGSFGVASGISPLVTLSGLMTHPVDLMVDDGRGGTASDQVLYTVVDTTAPALNAGADVELAATGPGGVSYDVLSGVTAADSCDTVNVGVAPAGPYPLGNTVVKVSASDPTGNMVSAMVNVSVRYSFGGFLPPLRPNGVYHSGRTIPVKFRLLYADGTPVTDAVATLEVVPLSGATPVVTEVGSDPHHAKRDREEHHSGNWGHTERRHAGSNLFRYRADGAMYMLNLETDRRMRGIYRLVVHLNDGGSFFMDVQLR
ncbi:MAG: PxKF domain-containing protein [Nitrospirota bacterium]|nr:PxKF domain-containing protein [Nitrospirota bacterium]